MLFHIQTNSVYRKGRNARKGEGKKEGKKRNKERGGGGGEGERVENYNLLFFELDLFLLECLVVHGVVLPKRPQCLDVLGQLSNGHLHERERYSRVVLTKPSNKTTTLHTSF